MRNKPVPLKEGATIETMDQYLARGGKVTKCTEGKAEGIWTAAMAITPVPKNERVSDPVNKDKLPEAYRRDENHTKPITAEFA